MARRGGLFHAMRPARSGLSTAGESPGRGRPRRPDEEIEEDTLDERIRQMIRELERALSGAFTDSEDVHEVLRRLRDEGYGLIIVLDRREGRGAPPAQGSSPDDAAVRADRPADRERPPSRPTRRLRLARLAPSAPAGGPGRDGGSDEPPAFLIDAADLAFLRSIGIDPTRKIRGRKAPRSSSP